jgi:hypothetical protein
MFTLELNAQLQAIGSVVVASAAHPGWTATGLQHGWMAQMNRFFAQSPPMGALPTLRAVVDADVRPNDYYGPGGFMEMRGNPKKVDTAAAAKDAELAKRLWAVSEEMTGVHYNWQPVTSEEIAA